MKVQNKDTSKRLSKNINFRDGLGLELDMPKSEVLVEDTSKDGPTDSKSILSGLTAKPGLGINLAGAAGNTGKPMLGLKGLGGGTIDLQKLIKQKM